MKVLVSACLLGQNCKYNGGNNLHPGVLEFLKGKEVVPICPEVLAGLPTPRPPAELVQGRVCSCHGEDLDAVYRRGVEAALAQIQGQHIDLAILQSRSPTCGVRQVYDGTFTGRLVPGQGLFAQALLAAGCPVADAEEF